MIDARIALSGQPVDISGLYDSYVDGAKMRQHYDNRQQQKLLNQIARLTGDDVEARRNSLINDSRYADDIRQTLAARETAARKEGLANLKTGADINYINAQANDKNATAAKTRFDVATSKQNAWANIGAGTYKNPQTLAKVVGLAMQSGVVDPETGNHLVDTLNQGDLLTASKVLEALGRTNPDFNKLLEDNATAIEKANIQATASMYGDDQGLRGKVYGADQDYNASVYGADRRYDASVYGDDTGYDIVKLQEQGENARTQYEAGQQGNGGAVLPAPALKMVDDMQGKIDVSIQTIARVDDILAKFEQGQIDLGVVDNAVNSTRNYLGFSTEQSRNYERVKSTLHDMANQVLLMAKGVQTEGDAKRAYNTIIAMPLTDNAAVQNAFKQLRTVAENTATHLQQRQANVYQNYGYNLLTPQQQQAQQQQALVADIWQ